jgi:arylsulfatase A-like enzyme
MINRRDFMKTASVAAVAAAAQPGSAAARTAGIGKKPNLLIVVCDQMTNDIISAYRKHFDHNSWLCHWVETPNLDELAHNGVSFTESYSTNPVCCPARSSLFTGRYSLETGVVTNNIGIDKSVPNMGQWFEQHSDYDRVYCGKWHAGGPWNNPHVSGPRKIPGFETIPNGPDSWGRHMDYGVSSGVEAYIRNHKGEQPFLAVAGFMDPHDICFWTAKHNTGRRRTSDFFDLGDDLPPLPPNKDYQFDEVWGAGRSNYSDLEWRNYIYDYCRMVERLDRNVGRLLRAVRDRGDDTMILFTSDHGDGLARHSRVSKWHPYDESVKVPFIAYGPKLGIRRDVIDTTHLVSGVDIMATVCDYAGIPTPPHSRGLSLRPLLEGKQTEWRKSVFIELREVGRVICSDRYKYVMSYEPVPKRMKHSINENYLTRDGKPTMFLPGSRGELQRVAQTMLFDKQDDPWETRNLAGDPKFHEVIAEHEAMLRDHEAALIAGREFTRK